MKAESKFARVGKQQNRARCSEFTRVEPQGKLVIHCAWLRNNLNSLKRNRSQLSSRRTIPSRSSTWKGRLSVALVSYLLQRNLRPTSRFRISTCYANYSDLENISPVGAKLLSAVLKLNTSVPLLSTVETKSLRGWLQLLKLHPNRKAWLEVPFRLIKKVHDLNLVVNIATFACQVEDDGSTKPESLK